MSDIHIHSSPTGGQGPEDKKVEKKSSWLGRIFSRKKEDTAVTQATEQAKQQLSKLANDVVGIRNDKDVEKAFGRLQGDILIAAKKMGTGVFTQILGKVDAALEDNQGNTNLKLIQKMLGEMQTSFEETSSLQNLLQDLYNSAPMAFSTEKFQQVNSKHPIELSIVDSEGKVEKKQGDQAREGLKLHPLKEKLLGDFLSKLSLIKKKDGYDLARAEVESEKITLKTGQQKDEIHSIERQQIIRVPQGNSSVYFLVTMRIDHPDSKKSVSASAILSIPFQSKEDLEKELATLNKNRSVVKAKEPQEKVTPKEQRLEQQQTASQVPPRFDVTEEMNEVVSPKEQKKQLKEAETFAQKSVAHFAEGVHGLAKAFDAIEAKKADILARNHEVGSKMQELREHTEKLRRLVSGSGIFDERENGAMLMKGLTLDALLSHFRIKDVNNVKEPIKSRLLQELRDCSYLPLVNLKFDESALTYEDLEEAYFMKRQNELAVLRILDSNLGSEEVKKLIQEKEADLKTLRVDENHHLKKIFHNWEEKKLAFGLAKQFEKEAKEELSQLEGDLPELAERLSEHEAPNADPGHWRDNGVLRDILKREWEEKFSTLFRKQDFSHLEGKVLNRQLALLQLIGGEKYRNDPQLEDINHNIRALEPSMQILPSKEDAKHYQELLQEKAAYLEKLKSQVAIEWAERAYRRATSF